MAESRDRMRDWIGRLLCGFGFHDYRLIEVVGAFGASGQVHKLRLGSRGMTARHL